MPTDVVSLPLKATVSKWHIGRPPIPHEHGAWFMLYIPLLIPLLAGSSVAAMPSLILILVATSAFMGQNAFRLVMKQHRKSSHVFWFVVYLLVLFTGVTALLTVYGHAELIVIGGAAAVVYGIHVLVGRLSRKRFDRSVPGEILAVAALALTAPAAFVITNGALDRLAWLIYGACVLYFTSGVFYINMLLTAGRVKGTFDRNALWTTGRNVGLYHTVLTLLLIALLVIMPGWSSALMAVAGIPIIVRAFRGWMTLTATLPPLTRVGLKEAAYAVWFAVWFQAALRWLA